MNGIGRKELKIQTQNAIQCIHGMNEGAAAAAATAVLK